MKKNKLTIAYAHRLKIIEKIYERNGLKLTVSELNSYAKILSELNQLTRTKNPIKSLNRKRVLDFFEVLTAALMTNDMLLVKKVADEINKFEEYEEETLCF